MGYAVELTLNEREATRICDAWEAVDSIMPRIGAIPHVSLAVLENADVEILTQVVKYFARETPVIRVRFSSLSIFPGRERILFIAPVVTSKLLRIHANFHQQLAEHAMQSDPLYLPESWVPHCTLTLEESPEQCIASFRELSSRDLFGGYTVDGIQIVHFRPLTCLVRFPLGDGGAGP